MWHAPQPYLAPAQHCYSTSCSRRNRATNGSNHRVHGKHQVLQSSEDLEGRVSWGDVAKGHNGRNTSHERPIGNLGLRVTH